MLRRKSERLVKNLFCNFKSECGKNTGYHEPKYRNQK